MPETRVRKLLRAILAVFMTLIGVAHLVRPDLFMSVMPPFVPAPLVMVIVSGVAEIAGGVGLLIPQTRRAAGIGLVALYIAVFPANLHMARHHIAPAGMQQPAWALCARRPLQIVLIAWALWVSRTKPRTN